MSSDCTSVYLIVLFALNVFFFNVSPNKGNNLQVLSGSFLQVGPNSPGNSETCYGRKKRSKSLGSLSNSQFGPRTSTGAGGRSSFTGQGQQANPVPFPIPEPDYDNEVSSLMVSSRRSGYSGADHAPSIFLPEPDYHTNARAEANPSDHPASATRRRISRSASFSISNLIANQASARARRFSHTSNVDEDPENENIVRRVKAAIMEVFSRVDESMLSERSISTEIPESIRDECRRSFVEAISLISKLNSEVNILRLTQEHLRNCNCETKRCARCQDNLEAFDSRKLSFSNMYSALSSITSFLYSDCLSGPENRYETDSHKRYVDNMYTMLYGKIMDKNRLCVKRLLLRCDIISESDSIVKKQSECRKCRKKKEFCKKHSTMFDQLREIETFRTAIGNNIEFVLKFISENIYTLPGRHIQLLEDLELQDELFLASSKIVKDCMKKLKASSTRNFFARRAYINSAQYAPPTMSDDSIRPGFSGTVSPLVSAGSSSSLGFGDSLQQTLISSHPPKRGTPTGRKMDHSPGAGTRARSRHRTGAGATRPGSGAGAARPGSGAGYGYGYEAGATRPGSGAGAARPGSGAGYGYGYEAGATRPGSGAGTARPGSGAGTARPGSGAGYGYGYGYEAGATRPGSGAEATRPGSGAGTARPGSGAGYGYGYESGARPKTKTGSVSGSRAESRSGSISRGKSITRTEGAGLYDHSRSGVDGNTRTHSVRSRAPSGASRRSSHYLTPGTTGSSVFLSPPEMTGLQDDRYSQGDSATKIRKDKSRKKK